MSLLHLVSRRDFCIHICQKISVLELFGLAGTIKDYLIQKTPACWQGHLSPAQATQSPILSDSRDGASTFSLDSLVRCPTSLLAKKSLLMCSRQGPLSVQNHCPSPCPYRPGKKPFCMERLL